MLGIVILPCCCRLEILRTWCYGRRCCLYEPWRRLVEAVLGQGGGDGGRELGACLWPRGEVVPHIARAGGGVARTPVALLLRLLLLLLLVL